MLNEPFTHTTVHVNGSPHEWRKKLEGDWGLGVEMKPPYTTGTREGRCPSGQASRHVSPDQSVRHKQDACKKDTDPTDALTPTEDNRHR
eukprot:738574-Prymnesium_polylepis.1